jgi:hypothetical protein
MTYSSRTPCVSGLFFGCVLNLAASAYAIGDDVQLQPDRLNFGVVHVGAKVQGSVRVFLDPKAVKSAKANASGTAFVKVDSISQGTQDFGPGNTRGYCDIAVTLDTSKARKVSAPVVMTVGERRVRVPVSADIRPRKASLVRVLVADTPFQKFSTGDARLFDPWLKLVESGGFDVDYVEVRSDKTALDGIKLEQYDTVLLGELGVVRLSDDEIVNLRKYVQRGGRVILTANAFFKGTVEKANSVLLPCGLEILDSEMPLPGLIEVGKDHISPCALTERVKALSFHRPSPGVVLHQDRTMVVVSSPAQADQHLVAFASDGKGQVVSLGVSLWWAWVGKADNAILLENLLRRKPKTD